MSDSTAPSGPDLAGLGICGDSYDALIASAERLGFEWIGEGDNAAVFAHPDHPDIVVRIAAEADGFLLLAVMAAAGLPRGADRTMLPVVYDARMLESGAVITVIERLHELGGRLEEVEDVAAAYPDQAASLLETARHLLQALDHYGIGNDIWDLGSGNAGYNIMQRSDGRLVLSDPLGSVLGEPHWRIIVGMAGATARWPSFANCLEIVSRLAAGGVAAAVDQAAPSTTS
ncbi:hypothetical protein FE249_17815 (plasmid) [Acidiphilium multivorum]|uniref:hypothetical protein n=1 Tax=Acidiphilium multivorum TaxID=62140 RepID=UPI001F4BE6A2|nr:hypothetical protein [Acidiphilium multivorum]UNC16113.1 hypothetical protein FE249_17815 [Acidiphilium multivorum]